MSTIPRDPKNLSRYVEGLEKRLAKLENKVYPEQIWNCTECDCAWTGSHNSTCPNCGSKA